MNNLIRAAGALLFFASVMSPGRLLAAAEVIAVKDADTPPKAVKQSAPIYPYELVKADVAGYVEMDFVIDAEGRTRSIKVIHSNNPWLERSAINALREWKYTPAQKNGKPVAVLAKQRIEFSTNFADGSPWQMSKGKDHAKLPPELRWDTPPQPVWITFPVYPYDSLLAKQAGQTLHRLLIDPAGNVAQIQQMEATSPEMGLAVRAMLEAWKFRPAKNDKGEACFATFSMRHDFKPAGRSDVPVTASAREIMALLGKSPGKIVGAKELDGIPALVSKQSPIFPTSLRATTQEGQAVIEFFIDAQGDAQLPHIISATKPEFGYAAAQAVSTWRFEPPLKGGKPVITKLRAPVQFKNSSAAKSTP